MSDSGSDREMTRRTYFFSKRVADELAVAVARLHHGSVGRLSKGDALDAIITAGLAHVDELEQRLHARPKQ
jgi:hypothetical protein